MDLPPLPPISQNRRSWYGGVPAATTKVGLDTPCVARRTTARQGWTLGAVTLLLAASPPPAASSGPNWLTFVLSLLGTFVVGIGTALLVQFYVVPKVEKRKRREDRWERDVLELGELLTTLVRRQAEEAYGEQSTYRFLQQSLDGVSGIDQEKLSRAREDQGTKAYQATEVFHDLVNTRVEWLVDRIKSIRDPRPRIIAAFEIAARRYWLDAMAGFVPEHDNRTDSAFDAEWKKERETRNALVKQVRLLADLPYLPRAPLRRRFTKCWRTAWRRLRGRSQST